MTIHGFTHDFEILKAEIINERGATDLEELIEQIRKHHLTDPRYAPDDLRVEVDALLCDLTNAYEAGQLIHPELRTTILDRLERIVPG